MNLLLSTLVLLAGLTQSSSDAVTSRNKAQQSSQPQVEIGTFIIAGEDSLIGEPFLPAQAQETVLVVPTPDLSAESLADLTEDLTVMCRIFDKSLAPTRATTSFAYGGRGNVFGYTNTIGQQTRGTQGLYLDGYGALFFVHVDYPLVPTEPQEPPQAKAKESADAVWSAAVKEMSGQPGEDQQAARSARTYDPQKVENLKKAAIKTLAHTSNIRMRRPQDVITLVVGALDDSKTSSFRRYPTIAQLIPDQPDLNDSRTSSVRSTRSAESPTPPVPLQPRAGKPRPTVRNPTAALLVMRVTKADVDAFAKGQLTAAQFTEKVQTLWSRPNLSEPQGKTPTPTAAPATRR